MINERERRLLQEMALQTSVEDPAFAQRLTSVDPLPPADEDVWKHWRQAWRAMTRLRVLLVLLPLAVVSFALHVSSVGLLLLVWALIIVVRRQVRAG
ncbi:MAG: hypothetical protein QOH17_4448 [Pseudonocardiales bacterium]|jgi:hypothetical protein|nr:hypothetical protein [Pseudonocardiales bacterium]